MNKFIILIIFMTISTTARSDIYQYTNESGISIYTDLPSPPSKEYKLTKRLKTCEDKPILKSQRFAIEKYIKNNLSDPYSAHFKWSKSIHGCEDSASYCVFVNAKNKFGGYVGYIPFRVNLFRSKNGWKVEIYERGEKANCPSIDE
jgi:hypothetical protein